MGGEEKSFANVIAFVNMRSGVQNGASITNDLVALLGKDNVFDLSQGGPRDGLLKHRATKDLRVLACGGDGTVGWVLSGLEEVEMESKPYVGILPIGTGNDLGRVLGWGFKYKNEPLERYVKQLVNGKETGLDR